MISHTEKLKKRIADTPDTAGVYLMKDASAKIIYIGKAKSLKKRLGSYLTRDLSTKTMALISNVSDIEYIPTPNEKMALLLEASLIRKHKPKYNVSLRDDKSFPFVKIANEEFPAVYITRKREPDGAVYLGPYTSAKLLRQALKIIRRTFPYRSCKNLPRRACIYYRLKLSPAPCIGKISRAQYAKTIKNIRLVLEGATEALLKKLSREMLAEAGKLRFEEASKIRDQISALSALQQPRESFSVKDELEGLQNLAGMKKLPERIEAFDISDIFGQEACGSMVSFYRGQPDKNNYRRFRIKTIETIDDYAMLREVVRRRYHRLVRENLALPDLVIIDGGRSHLLAAEKEIRDLGIVLPVISIAKDKENIYIVGKEEPVRFGSDTAALNLIRRVRDEAHRFALRYHHILRRKRIIGK